MATNTFVAMKPRLVMKTHGKGAMRTKSKPDVDRNVKTKATTSQKARMNKVSIIISLKAVKNAIPKNSV